MVYDATGTNNKYSQFIDIVNRAHESCFPLIKLKINNKQESKPWITSSILKSVEKRTTC